MSQQVSLLAVPLALLSNLLVSLGYVLQKKAARGFPKIETCSFRENLRNFLTNPVWLIGILLTTLSTPTTLAAYSIGSITLVNSMGGTVIIFLTLFSRYMLKEPIRKGEYFSLLFISIGISLAGFFSSNTLTQESFAEFSSLILSNFVSILFLIFIVILAQLPFFPIKSNNQTIKGIFYAISAGLYMSIDIIAMGGLGSSLFKWNWSGVRLWQIVVISIVVIITPNLATIMLQYAYQKSKAITVIPVYNNIVLIIPIVYGGLFLKEWTTLTITNKLLLIMSLIIIVVSTIFLASFRSKKEEDVNQRCQKIAGIKA